MGGLGRDAATRPAEQAAATPGNAGIALPNTTNVAAFGDSLMWGQGLNRQDRFTAQIARALPQILGTQQAVVSADTSRSGAQIRGRSDERTTFVDRFPALFPNQAAIEAFLQGRSEQPAVRLYGEVPAPFPTIRGQIDLMTDALGATIDVALVDGGVNDINVEDIVNPQVSPHEYIERWDGQIRPVGHDDVLELLGRVRRKCPNALVLYFGFFAPMSYRSDTDDIRDLFKYETDDSIGWILNEIFGCEDVNAAILEAVTRAVWLQGRWQYWTRQAVVDANSDNTIRGPGVLFVPSGFNPDNSAFGNTPFLWQDYRAPTGDPAEAVRRQRCPRAAQVDDLQNLYDAVVDNPLAPQPPSDEAIQRMHDAIDGPTSLKTAMRAWIADHTRANLVTMTQSVRDEILRIRHALIASCGHPNPQGASSYANHAIERIAEHRAVTQRIMQESRPRVPAVAQPETLDQMLTRYRLRRRQLPLAADATHLDVDSLAVLAVTAGDSDQNFFPDVWLVLTTDEGGGRTRQRQYLLNFPYHTYLWGAVGPVGPNTWWVYKPYPHFEPGATNRLTVATEGRLRLEQITASSIMIGGDRLQRLTAKQGYGRLWRPQTVRLEINGRQVVDLNLAGQAFGFLSRLDLQYPVPAPQAPTLQLAPVTLNEVQQLGPRVNARRAEAPTRVQLPAQAGTPR
jgi:hypothetical protein